MPDAVVLEGVSHRYRAESGVVEALHAVDARLRSGSLTAVVGASGSGKSTLLRLLAGQEIASSGRVVIDGVDLADVDLRGYRREGVTYVAQRAAENLFPHLTLEEHGAVRLRALGLEARRDARAATLSGGEQARAAFAVALARKGPLLVVDEPTAELDSENAAGVLRELRRAAASGTTVVLATHDESAVAIADHVLELGRAHGSTRMDARRTRAGGDPVLRASGLTKRYSGVPVVAGASLELRRGELAALVGRSGSGKSTLLMLLGGWIGPDEGTVDPRLMRWRDLGYVPQRFGLVPELTVAENVELPARFGGAPAVEADALGLTPLAGRHPGEISIGQQQRAALARALRLRPRVLIVDEPTSHQDPGNAELVWQALRRAADAGTSCLVATHDPDAADRADVGWVIDDGRLEPLA